MRFIILVVFLVTILLRILTDVLSKFMLRHIELLLCAMNSTVLNIQK